MENLNDNLRLHSISSAAKALGLGRDTITKLISGGKLGTITIGKRKKIAHTELIRFENEMTKRIVTSKPISNICGDKPYEVGLTKLHGSPLDVKGLLENIIRRS